MATLNATLRLEATAGQLGDSALSLEVTDALTVGQNFRALSRATVTTVGANNIIQPATDGQTYYLYVKHTGTSDGSAATTETLNVELTGDVIFGKLAAGEFCFIPIGSHSLGVQLQSSSGNIVAEYAYFVRG